MQANNILVCIVDADSLLRRSLKRLVTAFGFKVRTFASLGEFSGLGPIDSPICLILDAETARQATDPSGVLDGMGADLHVIVITVSDGESERQLAKDLNATMCLQKPIDSQALLDSIRWSFEETRPNAARESGSDVL